jgi:hypothetical protein
VNDVKVNVDLTRGKEVAMGIGGGEQQSDLPRIETSGMGRDRHR